MSRLIPHRQTLLSALPSSVPCPPVSSHIQLHPVVSLFQASSFSDVSVSAWNAFLWPPYLAWSRWYFTPFCFPLERDWPSFGPQLRQVYLWHTLWVIFLPLASCVFFFLCLFLTLIFNSLQFSLLLVFHVQHYIWKALLCPFGYITGDKEICLWLPA